MLVHDCSDYGGGGRGGMIVMAFCLSRGLGVFDRRALCLNPGLAIGTRRDCHFPLQQLHLVPQPVVIGACTCSEFRLGGTAYTVYCLPLFVGCLV